MPPTELVARRTRDSKTYQLPGGKRQVVFAPFTHYQNDQGVWEDVDLNFRFDGLDRLIDKHLIAFRADASGLSIFHKPTGRGIRFNFPRRPDRVSGRTAEWDLADGTTWRLTARKTGLKTEATVIAKRGPKTYTFSGTMLGGLAPPNEDGNGNLVQPAGHFVIQRPEVLGANGVVYPTSGWTRQGGNISFNFDDTALPNEALPYVIDPTSTFNVAASGDDGEALGSGAGYPPSATLAVSANASIELQKTLGANYTVSVALIRFDTSSLPDDATIDSATLRIRVTATDDINSRSLTVEWYDAGTIGTEDYTATVGTDAHAGTAIGSISGGADNDFVLVNVSNVSKTGYTGLRLHISGGAPTGGNFVFFAAFDHATLTEPRLIVEYTEAAGGFGIDTRSKRASAIYVSSPWRDAPVLPNGSIGAPDRSHTAYMYSGLLVEGQPSGTSVATLPSLISTATGIHEQIGTSVATLPNLTTVTAGVMEPSGTTVATLPNLTVASAGVHEQTGTAADTLPNLAAEASSTQVQSGTITATLPNLTATSVGILEPAGTAAVTLPNLVSSATGALAISGTSEAALPNLTASAVGVMLPSGTSVATLPNLTAVGTAEHIQTGTSASLLPNLTTSATGVMHSSGVVVATLPSLSSAAPGIHEQTGTSVASLPNMTASAVGVMQPAGTTVATLPSLTAIVNGVHEQIGTVVAVLPNLTASASGTALAGAEGTSAATLPNLTVAAIGVMQPSGTSAATLPNLSAAATGEHTQSGVAAAILPNLTSQATGILQPSGTASATLPNLSAVATSVHEQSGTSVAALPNLTATAAGVMQPSATAITTLPNLTASATGSQVHSGTASVTLPNLVTSAAGDVTGLIGTAVSTLPNLTTTAIGIQTYTATVVTTLPNLTTFVIGVLQPTGVVTVSLPGLVAAIVGEIPVGVIVEAVLSGMVDLEDLIDRQIWPDNVDPSGYVAPEEVITPSGFIKDPNGTNLWDF